MIKRPILFEDTTGAVTADTFRGNGLGVLIDAISCEVTEELDGVFELNMRYPQNGMHFAELKTRRIIYAKASDELGWQPFRIVKIGRSLKGICTVYAQHYSYDLNGVTVSPFTAEHVEDALDAIKANSVPENPFTFSTNKNTEGEMEITVPRSVRNAIVGEEGSLLATYKGDLVFDHSTVTLLGKRGSDRGFRILYGKNMTGLDQTEDVQKLYTAIYPYFYSPPSEAIGEDMEGSPEIYIELDEKTVQAEGDFSYSRVKVVDFSDNEEMMALVQSEDADEDQKKSKLKMLAREYLKDNDIGVHRMAVTATFERLKNSAEAVGKRFEDIKVQLGDTVSVLYPKLGTDVKARIVRMVFDSLADRVKKVEIGEVKTRITDSFSSLESKVREHETRLGETKKAVARLNVFTDEDVATIRGMTEWEKETGKSIATLDATSQQNSASIGLMVEVTKDENGETVTKGKGEFFIRAINGDDDPESVALIRADKIAIKGTTTFSSLFTEGKTTIDGGKITAGTLKVDEVAADGATIGGWTITKDRLYKATEDSADEMDSPCGMYSGSDLYGYYWDSLVTEGGKSPIRFYAGGSPVEKTCNFAVLEDGSVYLGAARIYSEDSSGSGSIELAAGKFRSTGDTGYIDMNDGIYQAYTTQNSGVFWKITARQSSEELGQDTDLVIKTTGSSLVEDKAYTRFGIETMVLSLIATHGGYLSGKWDYAGHGEILTASRVTNGISALIGNGTYNKTDTVTVYKLAEIFNHIANA